MKCRNCTKEMNFICSQTNKDHIFIFNVFHCNDCGILLKKDVGYNNGLTWITIDGIITEYENNSEPYKEPEWKSIL